MLLAADANAILQAILGRASLAVESGRVELVTTMAKPDRNTVVIDP